MIDIEGDFSYWCKCIWCVQHRNVVEFVLGWIRKPLDYGRERNLPCSLLMSLSLCVGLSALCDLQTKLLSEMKQPFLWRKHSGVQEIRLGCNGFWHKWTWHGCLKISHPFFLFVGVPFPKNFMSVAKTILKRLFRVYAHIYHQHFDPVIQLQEEAHLNTSFKHFIFFVQVSVAGTLQLWLLSWKVLYQSNTRSVS